jgi:hypothetical protein
MEVRFGKQGSRDSLNVETHPVAAAKHTKVVILPAGLSGTI